MYISLISNQVFSICI